MRSLPLVAFLLALAPTAFAQVTTNDQALDSLKAPPSKSAPKPAPAHTTRTRHTATHTASGTHTHPAASAARQPPQVPPGPPANPVIAPPPIVLPTHPPPPPPIVPLKPDAAGTAIPLPDGTRITFGPQKSDLNPATLAAIQAIAKDALANPTMIVAVTAWAPGTPDDPSTPRRLSLDRALAARAVLINAGIASERIRTVAKGMNDIGQASPDRVDVQKILPPPPKP
jgi:outer membrane protein OmpA-like peptidoglycan-associated protein